MQLKDISNGFSTYINTQMQAHFYQSRDTNLLQDNPLVKYIEKLQNQNKSL